MGRAGQDHKKKNAKTYNPYIASGLTHYGPYEKERVFKKPTSSVITAFIRTCSIVAEVALINL